MAAAGQRRRAARPGEQGRAGRGAELWVDAQAAPLRPEDGRNLLLDGDASGCRAGAASGEPSYRSSLEALDHRVVVPAGCSSSCAEPLDHLVVPVVGAQEQVAQARHAHVGLGVGARRRSGRPRAASSTTGSYSSLEPRLGDLARGMSARRGPASRGSPTPRRASASARVAPLVARAGSARAPARRQRHALEEEPLVALQRQVARRIAWSAPTCGEHLGHVGVDVLAAQRAGDATRGGGRPARSAGRRSGRRRSAASPGRAAGALAIRSQRARTCGRAWAGSCGRTRARGPRCPTIESSGIVCWPSGRSPARPSASTTSSNGRIRLTSSARGAGGGQARERAPPARAAEVVLRVGAREAGVLGHHPQ